MSATEVIQAVLAAGGIKLAVVISAGIGGWISLRFFTDEAQTAPKAETLQAKACVALWGASMGTFLAGPTVDAFALNDRTGRIEIALGMIIAVFGMSVTSRLIKAIREFDFKVAVDAILAVIGKR